MLPVLLFPGFWGAVVVCNWRAIVDWFKGLWRSVKSFLSDCLQHGFGATVATRVKRLANGMVQFAVRLFQKDPNTNKVYASKPEMSEIPAEEVSDEVMDELDMHGGQVEFNRRKTEQLCLQY